MRRNTGENPFKCLYCNKTQKIVFQRNTPGFRKDFTQSGNLNDHMKTHTGVRPYSCKLCDKKFMTY